MDRLEDTGMHKLESLIRELETSLQKCVYLVFVTVECLSYRINTHLPKLHKAQYNAMWVYLLRSLYIYIILCGTLYFYSKIQSTTVVYFEVATDVEGRGWNSWSMYRVQDQCNPVSACGFILIYNIVWIWCVHGKSCLYLRGNIGLTTYSTTVIYMSGYREQSVLRPTPSSN